MRSFLFSFCFFFFSVFCCLFFLPAAASKTLALRLIYFYLDGVAFLEKNILGLDYEIRGLEHLPKSGSYIVAAKHYSTYETLKLHKIFKNPAIILKKELTQIPIWGHFLQKLNIIPIDRSNPGAANASIVEGAQKALEQGDPIIIFPQGTRVSLETSVEEKPYKSGVFRMAEACQIPIVPLALNSGYFWPKKGMKKPGKVVFEFLEPLSPGLEHKEVIRTLENKIENHSLALLQEAGWKRKANNILEDKSER